ncbi:DUF6266 family protein [Hymenobacter cellulosivorans]|uniref:DUF6266 family protein n=1 Tax=Hymenobacter cellulosivorans TaxID=2932249 RepID=A0ABY4F520_9BACT|nr:DUF6266 family protein [Hymenobacter cellulosivorans]UOQ51758.1 DUF6266 family protein [Hymenobacter cellulosivorans]
MARIRSILGDIEGSAGQLTFTKVNGQNILRQKVGSNTSNTPAQQNTRSRFKLLADLYKKLAPALTLGLKAQGGQSAYNRFVGQNFSATSADAQNVASIDYLLMQLSAGSVEPLDDFVASKGPMGSDTITATWADNSNGAGALAADTVTVVVINKLTGLIVTDAEGAVRSDGTLSVTNARFAGVASANLVAYGFARRFDGSDASSTAVEQVS